MTTNQYFNSELHVHFTCSELYLIMSALVDYQSVESDAGRTFNAGDASTLRSKVKNFVDIYESSAVL